MLKTALLLAALSMIAIPAGAVSIETFSYPDEIEKGEFIKSFFAVQSEENFEVEYYLQVGLKVDGKWDYESCVNPRTVTLEAYEYIEVSTFCDHPDGIDPGSYPASGAVKDVNYDNTKRADIMDGDHPILITADPDSQSNSRSSGDEANPVFQCALLLIIASGIGIWYNFQKKKK